MKPRSIKRMRPKHYEILVRFVEGQKQKTIAREMGMREDWLSIVVNSPVFQQELKRRLDLREKAIIQKIEKQREREAEALALQMRYGRGDLPKPSPLLKRLREKPAATRAHGGDDRLGDRLVRALSRRSNPAS